MYDTFKDRSRALLDSYIDKLAYLRNDPALTPMEIEERDFIEYQKNKPVPGTVLDPQKLDLQEYLDDDPTRYTGEGAPYEPIDRLHFLMGPRSPLASAVQPEYYKDPQTGQLMSTTPSDTSYGGAPGRPLTPAELERLKGPKERTPPPPGFREQYLPKADNATFFLEQLLAENQGPSTPVKYYPDAYSGKGGYLPNPGAGRPVNVRPKGAALLI